jgi:hypothetical protein
VHVEPPVVPVEQPVQVDPLPVPTSWPELIIVALIAAGVGSGLPKFMQVVLRYVGTYVLTLGYEKVKDKEFVKSTLTPELFEQLKALLPSIQEFSRSLKAPDPIVRPADNLPPGYRPASYDQVAELLTELKNAQSKPAG